MQIYKPNVQDMLFQLEAFGYDRVCALEPATLSAAGFRTFHRCMTAVNERADRMRHSLLKHATMADAQGSRAQPPLG